MIRRPPRSTLFPTRRSSDLGDIDACFLMERIVAEVQRTTKRGSAVGAGSEKYILPSSSSPNPGGIDIVPRNGNLRSEEHTSELQSQSNLVCRLLLEKKTNSV